MIWRFEFGLWTYSEKLTVKDFFEIRRDKGPCGCNIFTVSLFYFTFLSGECYPALKKFRKREQ